MQIYLLRHGIAEDAGPGVPDADRALTGEGKKRVRDVIRTIRSAGVSTDLILSSPYRRALETARVAADESGYRNEILRTRALIPSASPREAWDEIRVHREHAAVLLVGHEPLFGMLAAHLLGVPELQVDFKKGAVVAIELPDSGMRPRGVLKWMITPKLTGA